MSRIDSAQKLRYARSLWDGVPGIDWSSGLWRVCFYVEGTMAVLRSNSGVVKRWSLRLTAASL